MTGKENGNKFCGQNGGYPDGGLQKKLALLHPFSQNVPSGWNVKQDAKRHGEDIAAVLLERHGGLLASDPKLVQLKEVKHSLFLIHLDWFKRIIFEQQQALVLKRDQKACRKPLVQNHISTSPEKTGQSFIEDSLLPSLNIILNDLQNQAQLLRAAMERSSPILHQIFPLNLSSALPPNRPPELLKQNREV